MKRKMNLLLIVCCILTIQTSGLCADNPEQLVVAHLKSIGEPDALSKIKSIFFTGTSEVNFIQGMQGQLEGTVMMASEGSKMGIVMNFPNLDYPGEHFAHDGKNVTVNNMNLGVKSPIADYIHRYNRIMSNGMLGGVFSNAWPLLDIKGNRPNMRLRKSKVDGTELYEIEYRPRNNHGDMTIRMYFDMETYRHMLTVYRVRNTMDVRSGSENILDAVQEDIYFTLTEKFGDFRKVGDLTLPHSYTL